MGTQEERTQGWGQGKSLEGNRAGALLHTGQEMLFIPTARLESFMTLRAMGRVFLRVLPQQQGIIAPRLHTASTPPENSIPN